MVLYDLKLPGQQDLLCIQTAGENILSIARQRMDQGTGPELFFENASIYPGLINSHDHLDFNCFPSLGRGGYSNYTEWGHDIHATHKELMREIQSIPLELRVRWGAYKNLLNGFTTVVNHGDRLAVDDDLISIFQYSHILHSPAFEKYWRLKLNNPTWNGKPVVMHIGEGVDRKAIEEIASVRKWNWRKRKLVAIHGVQMNKENAKGYAGLVWCPASNYFMFNQTTDVSGIINSLPVVFGTDSTLTGDWNAWKHFQLAGIGETELVNMLTGRAAILWGLKDRGVLAPGRRADLLVLRNKESFPAHQPEDILLVVHRGNIRLADASIVEQLDEGMKKDLRPVQVNSSIKFVQGDLPRLANNIQKHYPAMKFPFEIV